MPETRALEDTAREEKTFPRNLQTLPLEEACQLLHERLALVKLTEDGREEGGIHEKASDVGHNAAFFAAQRPDAEAEVLLREAVQLGLDLGQVDSNGQTVAFYAARDGNLKALGLLVDSGLDIDQTDHALQTPLYYAAREGRTAVVQWLVDHRADLNRKDANQDPPLFYAIRFMRIETVKMMLQLGASTSHRNKTRQTALSIARRIKDKLVAMEMEKMLSQFAGIAGAPKRGARQSKRKVQPSLPAVVELPPAVMPLPAPPVPPTPPEPPASPEYRPDTTLADIEPPRKRYCLQFKSSTGHWVNAGEEKVQIFEQLYGGEVAVWRQDVPVAVEPWPVQSLIEIWYPKIEWLMNEITQCDGSWIFEDPVDPKAWGIPNYFNVIKTPMDFKTIRFKIQSVAYKKLQEFLDDLNLVFDNCVEFNSANSDVGRIALNVQAHLRTLCLQQKLNVIQQKEETIESELGGAAVNEGLLVKDSRSSMFSSVIDDSAESFSSLAGLGVPEQGGLKGGESNDRHSLIGLMSTAPCTPFPVSVSPGAVSGHPVCVGSPGEKEGDVVPSGHPSGAPCPIIAQSNSGMLDQAAGATTLRNLQSDSSCDDVFYAHRIDGFSMSCHDGGATPLQFDRNISSCLLGSEDYGHIGLPSVGASSDHPVSVTPLLSTHDKSITGSVAADQADPGMSLEPMPPASSLPVDTSLPNDNLLEAAPREPYGQQPSEISAIYS